MASFCCLTPERLIAVVYVTQSFDRKGLTALFLRLFFIFHFIDF
jgi:hypothetical protein